MVRRDLAAVTDELESADNLANGEEAENLSSDDTTSGELGRADIPHLLDGVLGGLNEGAVLDGLDKALVGVLEGSQVAIGGALAGYPVNMRDNCKRDSRRAHPLVVEDELAELKADLGVVDDVRNSSCFGLSAFNG